MPKSLNVVDATNQVDITELLHRTSRMHGVERACADTTRDKQLKQRQAIEREPSRVVC